MPQPVLQLQEVAAEALKSIKFNQSTRLAPLNTMMGHKFQITAILGMVLGRVRSKRVASQLGSRVQRKLVVGKGNMIR